MTKTKIRQKWLFNELRKYPMNSYRDFLTMYIATFGKSERTFVRDWKEAQKELKAWNGKVMDSLIAKEVAKGVEEEKTYLPTRLEVLQYLSDIARGEPYDTDEGKVYPTFRDQLRAIEQLAKMEGWNAPAKQEFKGDFEVTGIKVVWEGEPE
jgi:hypothetical protein